MKKYLTSLGMWFAHHWKTVLGVTFKLALIVIGCFAAFVLLVIGRESQSVTGRMASPPLLAA